MEDEVKLFLQRGKAHTTLIADGKALGDRI
jgi:hypothetical protein